MSNYRKLIREALGLDLFYNLKPDEKAALKSLHKRYSNVKYDFEINKNDVINFMENIGFNFTTSMKLTQIYLKNRDKLFKEFHSKYYDLQESDIIYNGLLKYVGTTELHPPIEKLVRERFKDSLITKTFGNEDFYISCWTHHNQFSFYLSYKGGGLKSGWVCVVTYDYEKIGEQSSNITSIPFDVKLRINQGLEFFPMPELDNSTYEIEIPISFDFDQFSKYDVYEIVIGKNDSLFSDFEKRIYDIMSINN